MNLDVNILNFAKRNNYFARAVRNYWTLCWPNASVTGASLLVNTNAC